MCMKIKTNMSNIHTFMHCFSLERCSSWWCIKIALECPLQGKKTQNIFPLRLYGCAERRLSRFSFLALKCGGQIFRCKLKRDYYLKAAPTSLLCSRPSHVLIPSVFVLLFSSWSNCILLCPKNRQRSICKCLMMYTNANKPTDISELIFHP